MQRKIIFKDGDTYIQPKNIKHYSQTRNIVSYFRDVPKEVIFMILGLLPTTKAYDLCLVCKFFRDNAKQIIFTSIECSKYTDIKDENIILLTNLKRFVIGYGNKDITNKGIGSLVNLTYLDIRWANQITNKSIYLLTNLTHLTLYDNRHIADKSVSKLTNLVYLDTGGHTSYITNKSIISLKNNLTYLILGNNKTITNKGVSSLTNLTHIDLSRNKTITSSGISSLTNLTHLNLSYNNVGIADDGVRMLTNLTSLDIRNNDTITDESVNHLIKLVDLNIGGNSVITDRCLGNIYFTANLTNLNLEHNFRITNESVKKLTNLQTLYLYDNDLITNKDVSSLTNLTYLYTSIGNKIRYPKIIKKSDVCTIDNILYMFERSHFYYEIPIKEDVDEGPTEDQLHRHTIDEFEGCEPNCFRIHNKGEKHYLSMTLKIPDEAVLDEDNELDLVYTPENMKKAFVEYPDMLSPEGKLIIPKTFDDYVYLEDGDEEVDVTFTFSKVKCFDQRLLDYIVIQ